LTGLAIGAHRKRPDPPDDTATGQSISKTLADRPIVVQSGMSNVPASGWFLLIALASGQPWQFGRLCGPRAQARQVGKAGSNRLAPSACERVRAHKRRWKPQRARHRGRCQDRQLGYEGRRTKNARERV